MSSVRNEDQCGRCEKVSGGYPNPRSQASAESNFFRKFDRSRRFSGIFLDFFQNFFGGRRNVPSVARATRCADAFGDRSLAETRRSCGSRQLRAKSNAAPAQTSGNPIPVTVCGFSTATPNASRLRRFCPFGAGLCVHFASSTSVVDDVG